MNLKELLWKVPCDFDQKYEFPDLVLLQQCIKEEKFLAKSLVESLTALIKSYRTFSTTLHNNMPKLELIPQSTETGLNISKFINSRKILTEKLNTHCQLLETLKTQQVSLFFENISNEIKQFNQEIKNLRESIQPYFDEVQNGLKGYDKYVQKLIQLNQTSRINPQLISKAFESYNGKLMKMQSQYLSFRLQYNNYFKNRLALLIKVDSFISSINAEIEDILSKIDQLDNIIFPHPIQETIPLFKIKPLKLNLYDEPEIWPKKEISDKFYVILTQSIEIHGEKNIILNPKTPAYEVVSAVGDFWDIKNGNNIYTVPADILAPFIH